MELEEDDNDKEEQPNSINLHPKRTEDWWYDETIYETPDSGRTVRRHFHRDV